MDCNMAVVQRSQKRRQWQLFKPRNEIQWLH